MRSPGYPRRKTEGDRQNKRPWKGTQMKTTWILLMLFFIPACHETSVSNINSVREQAWLFVFSRIKLYTADGHISVYIPHNDFANFQLHDPRIDVLDSSTLSRGPSGIVAKGPGRVLSFNGSAEVYVTRKSLRPDAARGGHFSPARQGPLPVPSPLRRSESCSVRSRAEDRG